MTEADVESVEYSPREFHPTGGSYEVVTHGYRIVFMDGREFWVTHPADLGEAPVDLDDPTNRSAFLRAYVTG